jgi:hypothetical protein
VIRLVLAALALAGAKPLPGLPSYTAGYTSWTKLNSKPIPPRSADAHLGTKNVYASRLPPRSSRRYPAGTVIVKEIVRSGAKFIGVLAAMRKRADVKANNGWEMTEWSRPSTRARFTVLARGALCFSCHVQVKKTDYVFTQRR